MIWLHSDCCLTASNEQYSGWPINKLWDYSRDSLWKMYA